MKARRRGWLERRRAGAARARLEPPREPARSSSPAVPAATAPLGGFCRRCGAWCMYVVLDGRALGKRAGAIGHVLEAVATRPGMDYYMQPDGTYRRNWAPWRGDRWVSRAHRCRPADVAATLRREQRRERATLEHRDQLEQRRARLRAIAEHRASRYAGDGRYV